MLGSVIILSSEAIATVLSAKQTHAKCTYALFTSNFYENCKTTNMFINYS